MVNSPSIAAALANPAESDGPPEPVAVVVTATTPKGPAVGTVLHVLNVPAKNSLRFGASRAVIPGQDLTAGVVLTEEQLLARAPNVTLVRHPARVERPPVKEPPVPVAAVPAVPAVPAQPAAHAAAAATTTAAATVSVEKPHRGV